MSYCGCDIKFSAFPSTKLFWRKKHTAVMLIYTESSGERESNVAICVELKLKWSRS